MAINTRVGVSVLVGKEFTAKFFGGEDILVLRSHINSERLIKSTRN